MDNVSENVSNVASDSIKQYTIENMSCFIVGIVATLVFVLFTMISGCWAPLTWTAFGVSVASVYALSTGVCWYMRR